MKVLFVSDSHGLEQELLTIKERHQDEIDIMIHCGDSELPFESPYLSGYQGVRGNCDYDKQFPTEEILQVNNRGLLVTHGHLFNVKMTIMTLYYRAKEVGASIACFGHSHIAGAEMIDDILFINPGSIRLPRIRKEKTYAILTIDESQMIVSFYDIDGSPVEPLKYSCQLN